MNKKEQEALIEYLGKEEFEQKLEEFKKDAETFEIKKGEVDNFITTRFETYLVKRKMTPMEEMDLMIYGIRTTNFNRGEEDRIKIVSGFYKKEDQIKRFNLNVPNDLLNVNFPLFQWVKMEVINRNNEKEDILQLRINDVPTWAATSEKLTPEELKDFFKEKVFTVEEALTQKDWYENNGWEEVVAVTGHMAQGINKTKGNSVFNMRVSKGILGMVKNGTDIRDDLLTCWVDQYASELQKKIVRDAQNLIVIGRIGKPNEEGRPSLNVQGIYAPEHFVVHKDADEVKPESAEELKEWD